VAQAVKAQADAISRELGYSPAATD
jgi:hypothetical protein